MAEGVHAATSAWVAEERNRELTQGITNGGAGKLHSGMTRDAKTMELNAWKQFKAPESTQAGSISAAVLKTRWAPNWGMAAGKRSTKTRMAATGY